ncbi:Proline--tRNA ligase [Rathayibacter tanaceti]|uniref:Proline--tRNA ligase n=1 Tax=Rathayibacter tanaceti TaxID=1671680 RepID=A0A166IDN6_9MICO|nr:Proline--tRNA ligase [Rathayibacter tanaceti]
MVTRLSHLFVRTLREDPADAEVAGHRLLVRAGYIRRQAPGVFAWLPLGLRVKRRIERILHEEMEAAGAQEVHFPALLPREPYELTGRWTEYGDGVFRLKDRKDADYMLAPTHEEFFTLLVKDLYSSYKDLPLSIYQIQDKYRDEARPRAGLLRGREFTMKDAYSFDYTDAGLDASYQRQRDAYERIFARLGLEYVIVQADAGAMGGSRSEEFLHPTPVGEDTFVRSAGGYAANVEAYRTPVPEASPVEGRPEARVFDSPDTPTIQTLVDLANATQPRTDGRAWTAGDTLKNVVLALTALDGTRELVIVGLPGDRDVDLKRAEVAFAPAEVEAATAETSRSTPAWSRATSDPGRPRARSWVRNRPPVSATCSTRVWSTAPPGSPGPTSPVSTSSTCWRDVTSTRTAPSRSRRCAPAMRHPTAPARSRPPAAWRSATSSSSAASTPRSWA